jgi:hypothetical protein
MAAILSVTYTPNYGGSHRICFRTSQVPYCCYQDNTPTEVGVEKTTDIDLDEYADCLVDIPFEIGCTDTIVNGYVQPSCTDGASLVNRVAFSVEYDSTACTSFSIECEESGIAVITVTDSGSGYAVGEIPNVTITDLAGNGIGAVATANMRCPPLGFCDVQSITVDVEGQYYYYLNLINVVIDAPIGGGTTATADVTELNDCGVFTVPNCDGTEDLREYSLLGGPAYAVNLCSGGGGFAGTEYTLIQNPVGVSCCDCIQYNVVVRNPVDIYFTDCNQNIILASVEAGALGLTFCAIPNSVWPANKLDNSEILAITNLGNCP